MPAALLVAAAAVMLLGWLSSASLQAAGGAMQHPGFNDVAAVAAAVAGGDERSPDDLHYPVVRKKHRRTELEPVALPASPRLAPRPAVGSWIALASVDLPDPGTDTRPAFADIDRAPALPAAPQLRLRPGQAPPAA